MPGRVVPVLVPVRFDVKRAWMNLKFRLWPGWNRSIPLTAAKRIRGAHLVHQPYVFIVAGR